MVGFAIEIVGGIVDISADESDLFHNARSSNKAYPTLILS